MLRFDQVVKEFRDGPTVVRALDGVSLEVAAGEMVAVTGRSGSGKSTLLNLAGGLEEVTAGTVSVGGVDLASLPARARSELRRRSLGYVFQNLNLIASLTAAENVALPLEFDGFDPGRALAAATAALERVGVADLARRYPDELSGGQRQRVAIARAVVGPRSLILADEPTGALDEQTGRGVMELLASLAAEGAAVVVVTHDHELAAWAQRIVRLRDGAVESVTTRPAAPATAAELLA